MSRKTDGETAEPPSQRDHLDTDGAIEYPTPEPFDPKASAVAIIDEARSIQQLLKTYEENTRRLKEDVQEFIIREVAEESKFRTLSVAVAQDELTSLQNVEFIKFSRDYREEHVRTEEVMPTARMTVSTGSESAGRLPVRATWAETEHPFAPDVAVAMKLYGDVREVLLGWRSRNSLSDSNFSVFCDDLFSRDDTRMCVFFNGYLYSPFPLSIPEYVEATSQVLQDCFWDDLAVPSNAEQQHRVVDSAVRAYTKFSSVVSSQTRAQLKEHLWKSDRMADEADSASASEGSLMNNFAPQLVGDAHDCVVAVPANRLHGTQTFRGFFMRGNLVAVEHIGPQIDALRYLCTPSNTESGETAAGADLPADFADREKRRVLATFRTLFTSFCNGDSALGRNAVLVVAISPEALPDEKDDASPHSKGVVLSVRLAVPSLPFHWHFTWAEICAMGQMLTNNNRQSSGDTGVHNVVFKYTRLSVSALTPMDSLSERYFPILNKQVSIALSGGTRSDSETNSVTNGGKTASSDLKIPYDATLLEASTDHNDAKREAPSHSDPNEKAAVHAVSVSTVAAVTSAAATVATVAAYLLRRK